MLEARRDAPDPRYPRIALAGLHEGLAATRASRVDHRAEFQDAERPLVEAVADLAVDHRTGTVEPDQHGHDDEERREDNETCQRTEDIHRALDGPVGQREGLLEDRKAHQAVGRLEGLHYGRAV